MGFAVPRRGKCLSLRALWACALGEERCSSDWERVFKRRSGKGASRRRERVCDLRERWVDAPRSGASSAEAASTTTRRRPFRAGPVIGEVSGGSACTVTAAQPSVRTTRGCAVMICRRRRAPDRAPCPKPASFAAARPAIVRARAAVVDVEKVSAVGGHGHDERAAAANLVRVACEHDGFLRCTVGFERCAAPVALADTDGAGLFAGALRVAQRDGEGVLHAAAILVQVVIASVLGHCNHVDYL